MPQENMELRAVRELKKSLAIEKDPERRKQIEVQIAEYESRLELEIQAFAELLIDIYLWRKQQKGKKKDQSTGSNPMGS